MSKKISEIVNNMIPYTFWNEGTDMQQEFADNLVEKFCTRFAKYLYNGVSDNIIQLADIDYFTSSISIAIGNIDNAKWWCNRKNTNDFSIATSLLKDDDLCVEIIKKLKKKYN